MFSTDTWEERYQQGSEAIPWDTGIVASELADFFSNLDSVPKRVLEVGCGTGTNAIWMAQRGCTVTATDISPTAIKAAKSKCKDSKVDVDFLVSNILESIPVPNSSVDFVFDRGVYHVMSTEQRKPFVDRVVQALHKNGWWLCLAGSTDQIREPGELGPPQLKASELIDNIEEKFEVYKLERASFVLPNGKLHLAWKGLFRKRD